MRVAARHEVTSRWPPRSFWHELTSFWPALTSRDCLTRSTRAAPSAPKRSRGEQPHARKIDPYGTNGTEALGINDYGKIVGIYWDSNHIGHGFHT
jgi:hypothetical protein